MKQILLDTSFILTAVKNKIDFFAYLEEQGFQIIIPEEVIKELQGLKSQLALKILEKNKFKKTSLKSKTTDKGIINFAKQNPQIIVATLDREIKKSVQNPKLIIRGKKKLEVF